MSDVRKKVTTASVVTGERCGRRARIHTHHIQPRSRGGTDDLSNAAGLCFNCHLRVHRHLVDDWQNWVR